MKENVRTKALKVNKTSLPMAIEFPLRSKSEQKSTLQISGPTLGI